MRWFDLAPSKKPKELPINGDWAFMTGDNADWKSERLSDSSWPLIAVPAAWESRGHPDYDGIAWYRKHVMIPSDWKNSGGILFDLGKVDDEDQVYLNGEIIGSNTGWQTPRRYPLPMSIVKFGEDNVIAVRVNDTGGNGGIWEGPLKLITGTTPRFNVQEY